MSGETMRDRFAMAALTGMGANPGYNNCSFEKLASMAYDQADAALAGRGGDAPQGAGDAVKDRALWALKEAIVIGESMGLPDDGTLDTWRGIIISAAKEQSA